MLCPNCSRDIPIGKQYCPLCGHKIQLEFGYIEQSVMDDAGVKRIQWIEGWLRLGIALVIVSIVAIRVYNDNFETALVFAREGTPSIALPKPGAKAAGGLTHTPTWSPPDLPETRGSQSVGLTWRTNDKMRRALRTRGGGSEETEIAVTRGLAYLTASQFKGRRVSKPGHWPASGAEKSAIATATGAALLAFLGNGHTPYVGSHKKTVSLAVNYLQNAAAGGRVGPAWARHMEGQALSTAALAEAYAMTGDARTRRSAEAGLRYILDAQQPNGGWKDSRRAPGPETVYATAWQVYALHAARMSGLHVPDEAFKRARAFLEKITDPNTGRVGLFTVWRPGDPELPSRAQTAAAMAARLIAGEPVSRETIRRGARALLAGPPIWKKEWNDAKNLSTLRKNRDRVDLVYLFFGTQAMFRIGGEDWKEWNGKVLKPFLLQTQLIGGNWPHKGKWAHRRGPAWTAAMAVLCLEIYHRDQ